MLCKVDGCGREVDYTNKRLCQKHYFRQWRTGTTDDRKRKTRYQDDSGYWSLFKPSHPLACVNGSVREHRFIYYETRDPNPTCCELCGADIDWTTLHIDHIDENKSNNTPENLRALCGPCNVFRTRPLTSGCKHIFTIDGLSMSAHAWAAREDVKVAGHTIIRRRRDFGWSDFDCVYKERMTHHHTKTKKQERKYDEMRQSA